MCEKKDIKKEKDPLDEPVLTYGMKETPYWRKGMTIREYEEENMYYQMHYEDVQNNRYKPLWKQREEKEKN